MPKCRICGNTRSFGVSAVRPAAPTANGPIAGLWAEFDAEGNIQQVMSNQGEMDSRDMLVESPEAVVDVCMSCGSSEIVW